jgi:hypothetical protein
MPGPVSLMLMRNMALPVALADTATDPLSRLYFTALDRTLSKTCLSRLGSALTKFGEATAASKVMAISRSAAICWTSIRLSWTAFAISVDSSDTES